jgi:FKBP-type peptidyl-prolyl cis-trans isomerase 2
MDEADDSAAFVPARKFSQQRGGAADFYTAVHNPGALLSWMTRVYRGSVKIETGRRVTVRVELSVVGGDVLEKKTVEYIQGSGTMLPALEKVLTGLEKGAKRDGVLKAKEAFGAMEFPTKKIKRTEFPKDAPLKAGDRFAAKDEQKNDIVLQIEKVDKDEVEVRFLHPLADKDIKYSVEVVQVSDPRPPPMPAAALRLEEE